jgi:hypothetical protein
MNAKDRKWSERSQRDLAEEQRLRAELQKLNSWIAYCERNIRKLEESKASQLKHSVQGKNPQPEFLARTLRDLEDETLKLGAYREQRAQIEAEIEKLKPTPASAGKRAESQKYLAEFAAQRVKKDELIHGALTGLRRLLTERAELSAKMVNVAEAVDMTIGDDRLDSRRFEELIALLPEQLFAESERWAAWFLAGQDGLKPYVVVVDQLVLPETLARAGFYRFGDRLELADSEANPLLQDVCPIGRASHDTQWSYKPARIMPLKAFELLTREAPEDVGAARGLISKRNAEREEELKTQYIVEREAALSEHRKALRAQGLLVGGNPDDD